MIRRLQSRVAWLQLPWDSGVKWSISSKGGGVKVTIMTVWMGPEAEETP